MHKINTETATENGEFTDGDESQAIPPTDLVASWFNTVQRELCNIVTGLGTALNPSNDHQILDALRQIGMSSKISTGDIGTTDPIDSKLIIHSAANFAIGGTLAEGAIVIIIPMWSAGSADSITVSYSESSITIRKWNAFFGIVSSGDTIIGYPVLMPASDGSLTIPKLTASKVMEPNLVDFVKAETGEDLQPWQVWQLKSNWEVGQVKRVRCTDAADGGSNIIVFKNTTGTYRDVLFYPDSYRELMCVGEYDAGGYKWAVLITNGKN